MKLLVIIAFIVFIFIASLFWYFPTSYYHGKVSDHFDGELFYNPGIKNNKSITDLIRWWWSRERSAWPNQLVNAPHPKLQKYIVANQLQATFVNHATVLLQTKNVNLLTDPIWSERASPFSFIGPKRVRPPGVPFAELPPIHIVLISHNHYDHLDIATLNRLKNKFDPIFIVPLGNASLLKSKGMFKVIELDWWQTYQFKDAVITLLPTQHWSARWLNDRFRALWGSYGVDVAGIKVYFAGDTGYSNYFKEIYKRWGKTDLALLPIGSYDPRWFMRNNHLNPKEAVQAFKDLHAKKAIAIHYGTFQLSDESFGQPEKDLAIALQEAHLTPQDFMVLNEGATVVIK